MPRIKLLFPIAIFCLFLISCSKEKSVEPSTDTPGGPGSGANTLLGNWKFVSMNVKTKAVIEMKQAGVDMKSITFSDYDSEDEQGTMKITGNKMESKDWSYTVDDIAYGYFYENNVLIDSLELPLIVTSPASSSTVTYKLIGADSIYYQSGAIVNVGGTTSTSGPGGGRYKIENDLLTITSHYSSKNSGTNQGLSYTQTNSAKISVTMQRQ